MEKRDILILTGLLGILIYFVLPGWTKIFAFLIPTITLAYVYSNRNLNYYIITGCSCLYLLFPSSIFTLDASNPLANLQEQIMVPLNVIFGLIYFVPLTLAVAGIGISITNLVNPLSWLTGNATLETENTIKTTLKVIIVVVMILVVTWLASIFDWYIYGLSWIKDTVVTVFNWFCDKMGASQYRISSLNALLSQMNQAKIMFSVTSVYPVLLSSISVLLGIFYYILRTNPKADSKSETVNFTRPLKLNLTFVVFLLSILIIAFVFYLSYSLESFVNYQNIGFFSIYLTITSVLCVLLSLGVGSPTENSKNTPLGILFCVTLLFMYQNMFVQTRTLNILSNEFVELTLVQILNNALFVCPTESLLFHIFPESLVLFYFLRKNRVLSPTELDNRILELKNGIMVNETSANIHLANKDTKSYAKTQKIIVKDKQELNDLERQKTNEVKETYKTLSNQQFVIFLVSVVIFNVLFSSLHWFKSGLSFEVFWSSGLGFLYLVSGIIITMIGYRFGWFSAIASHAIYNSLVLFLVLLASVM